MKNSVSFKSELSKFGIGLFETIKVENSPIDLDLHMNRMFKSIESLNMNIKYNKEFLTKAILNYISDNKIQNKALRITVFDEGYNISTRDIDYNEEMYNKGFNITISPIKRGESIIYKHKTTNYYENIYTKKYANENGFDDGLFTNYENIILECSMSNIFFIKEDKVYTPNSNLPILNGIMKSKILDICNKLNIEVIEEDIMLKNIYNFDFVFISNSLMKAIKVSQIDEMIYPSNNDVFFKNNNLFVNRFYKDKIKELIFMKKILLHENLNLEICSDDKTIKFKKDNVIIAGLFAIESYDQL